MSIMTVFGLRIRVFEPKLKIWSSSKLLKNQYDPRTHTKQARTGHSIRPISCHFGDRSAGLCRSSTVFQQPARLACSARKLGPMQESWGLARESWGVTQGSRDKCERRGAVLDL
jgi:hypothetical protein